MTGLVLFAATRRTVLALLLIVLSALLVVACGPLAYSVRPSGGYLTSVSGQVPLLAAIAVQASAITPVPWKERTAARSLVGSRTLRILLLTGIAATIFALAATEVQPPEGVLLNGRAPLGSVALVRNFLALLGSALLFSSAAGPAFGWIVPVFWCVLPAILFDNLNSDPLGVATLVAQPDEAFLPFCVAVCLWAGGCFVHCRSLDLGVVGSMVVRLTQCRR